MQQNKYWHGHIVRMEIGRLPKVLFNYKSKERRNSGKSRNRWKSSGYRNGPHEIRKKRRRRRR